VNRLTYTALDLPAPICNLLTEDPSVDSMDSKSLRLLLDQYHYCSVLPVFANNSIIVYSREVCSTDPSHEPSVQT
jgi:hypothetical protein